MKYLAAIAVVLGCLVLARMETVADAGHSDPVCPRATRAIQNYFALAKRDTTRVADAVAAANAASAAFDQCADSYRTKGDAERAHYAAVGSAQYRFTAGRLLHLDGYVDQARDALNATIAEVADTIAWGTPEAPSAYREVAITVRDEAEGELGQLPDASPVPGPTVAAQSPASVATDPAQTPMPVSSPIPAESPTDAPPPDASTPPSSPPAASPSPT